MVLLFRPAIVAGLILTVTAGLILAVTESACAADFENPPVFSAQVLLGSQMSGPGYHVQEKVGSDGYLHIYGVQTPWGVKAVHGDQMMLVRIGEFRALDAMDRIPTTRLFGDAVVTAGSRPVKYAGSLVTSPVQTMKKTAAGLREAVKRIGSDIHNSGQSREGTMDGFLGTEDARREIAYRYHVDPYSDWPPLKAKLDELSRASAMGDMTMSTALSFIPGAGILVSNAGSLEEAKELVRQKTVTQLVGINRQTLLKAGADPKLIEKLLNNFNYTPTDVTFFTTALRHMGKLKNVDALVAAAAAAPDRDTAFFMRRTAELMVERQAQVHDITGFMAFPNLKLPLATSRSNGLTGVYAFDTLAWTKGNSQAIAAATAAARAKGLSGPLVLSITGTATPLARQRLAALGWKLEERTP